MTVFKRSKKIRKREKDDKIKAGIKKKNNSVNAIKKKSGSNNIFNAFEENDEMEQE